MGKNNNYNQRQERTMDRVTSPRPVPSELPTILEVKRVIPSLCFRSSVVRSLAYVVRDVASMWLCYQLFARLHTALTWTYWPTLPAYWALQGTLFMALFSIGHDCSHGSFSSYTQLNDLVGQVVFGVMMMPYYQWKLSHRRHHKHNANYDRDEAYYPVKATDPTARRPTLFGFGFGVGWFVYLVQGYYPRPVCHYNPYEPMFRGHLLGAWCSLAAVGTTIYCQLLYFHQHGLSALFAYYWAPLLVGASYMVVVTFLHHTEMDIPWYGDKDWDYVRGQLSTVDRHYGLVHGLIHNIGTHQVHHLFPRIPHYHLEEATRHFRQAFPELVHICHDPILPAFLRMFKKYVQQCVIPEETDIFLYK